MSTSGIRYAASKIRDPEPRGVASLVCAVVHDGKERSDFDAHDIQTVRDLLAKPGALEQRGVSEHLLERLPAQLDALQAYLEGRAGKWVQITDATWTPPFCQAFKPDALYSKALADCATAVAQCFEGGGDHLSLGEYLRANRLWAHVEADSVPDSKRLAASLVKFKEGIEANHITRESFDLLHGIFLNERMARSQFQHGPVRIGGREFEHVYKLDTDGKDVSEMDADKVKSFILHRYESEGKALNDCFFDRLYVRYGSDLFLILNEAGSVTRGKNNIPDDAAVSMREDGRLRDVGRVVHRQEAVNTLSEAGMKIVSDAKGLITGDGPLKQLLEADKRLAGDGGGEGSKAELVMKLILTATIGAPLLATAKVWGVVGLVAIGLIAAGRNISDYARGANDDFKMKAIYNAIGVGLATDEG